ncbi:hypothetical protein EXU29_18590 [Acinetobacter wuhouensis]|uniref:hypothetical protein n=1 Tax=Acinetobacter wuhouensis TaxID=1879050 RepID=UPI00102349F6|nr:hypothetical protein [Acinetobacter wuhouensis]RZG66212.1 hypothetical protein EXU29_18590 [Acinetobacter wuhouensis]
MKYLLLFFTLISSSIFAVTPNQNYANREPQRKEYAQSMQRTHDMLDRSIAAANDGKNVTQSGSSSGSLSDGSKATGGGKVTKPINPSGVAKAIVNRLEKAKSLGKASLPAFLGGAALQALIDGVGWVMDEGGKVYKNSESHPVLNPDKTQPNIYECLNNGSPSGIKGYSPEQACGNFLKSVIENQTSLPRWTFVPTGPVSCNKQGCYMPYRYTDLTVTPNKIDDGNQAAGYKTTSNPDYDPNAQPKEKVLVSNPELEQAINNYITNNTTNNITNNIVNNSYSYDSSNGASSADPSNALAVDAANDIRSAVNNASTSSSPNPVGSQRGYYKITDGTKTIEGYVDASSTTATGSSDTTTTTNPDGSTSTTGNSSFQLPAFCDWASIVCDWYKDWKQSDQVYKDHMTKTEEHQEKEKTFWEKVTDWFDWTKEEPDDKDQPEQEEPDTQGIFSKKFDAVFSLSKECPPDLKFNLETKYLTGTWDFSLNWLCIFFTFIAYPLQFLSHLIGLWVLYEACIRKEIKW